jgi:predicted metalloprotease with PDZ domain
MRNTSIEITEVTREKRPTLRAQTAFAQLPSSGTLICMNLRPSAVLGLSLLIFFSTVSSLIGAELPCKSPSLGNFVAFTIEQRSGSGTPALLVRLTFRVAGRSHIDLVFPSTWQGLTGLNESIHDLRALSASTPLTPGRGQSAQQVTFGKGTSVSLEYVYEPGSTFSGLNAFLSPVLDTNYFVLPGRTFLVYPDLDEHEQIPVLVEWKGFSPEYTLADNLEVGGRCHRANELLKVSNGIFIGGDFRLTRVPLNSGSVYLAARGEWTFEDHDFAARIAKIVSTERTFWTDSVATQYLIVLTSMEGPPGKYSGTAVEDALLLRISPGTKIDFDIDFLLAHEIFHAWNPAQLGEISKDPVHWFAEGFTDYYARKFLLRAGLIGIDQYLETLNTSYSEYVTSPVRDHSKDEIQSEYFSDYSAQKLPYLQGSLLALRWNALIREHSGGKVGLDDAMRLLRQRARRSEQTLTDESLGEFFGEFTGTNLTSEIHDYIAAGHIIPLPGDAFGNCVHTVQRPVFKFEAGFDIDALYRTGLIKGVKPASEAYGAGLRDGQIVLRNSAINPNDPNQAVEIDVATQEGRKAVRYLPRTVGAVVDQYQSNTPTGTDGCKLFD